MVGEYQSEKEHCFCPYCDEEIMVAAVPYCQPCDITIFYCPRCRKPLPRDNRVCPHCGADLRSKVSGGGKLRGRKGKA